MATTLIDMTNKKKPKPSAEKDRGQGAGASGEGAGLVPDRPAGLLTWFTKSVLETALNEEMTEHLGHEKNRVPDGRESSNVRNGTRPKTVLTHATGQVDSTCPGTGTARSCR